MSVYAVWAQIIDDTTGIQNIDSHGSVHDVEAEYEEDEGGTPNKQFCDGQTSKTPPRYAQDRMVGIYTRSQEAANIISEYLRDDVRSRIASGTLQIPLPQWYVLRTTPSGAFVRADVVLLRARMYEEFPRFSPAQIDKELDDILSKGVDNLSVGSILTQMQRRLPI